MKRLTIILAFVPVLLFAQMEKIQFTKKLTFRAANYDGLRNNSIYFSPKGILVEDDNDSGFIFDDKILPVVVDIENNVKFADYRSPIELPKVKFKKLSETDESAGKQCTFYKITVPDTDGHEIFKFCIAESADVDMVSRFNDNTGDQIKGFPVIMNFGGKTYILKSIENTAVSINADLKNLLAKYEDYKEERSVWEDEAVMPDEEAVAVDADGGYYVSTYKNSENFETAQNINLALDNLYEGSYQLKYLPKYCANLTGIIPNFKDENLKIHARDYAGQICDMYLGIFNYDLIDFPGTFEQIRYEENWFRNADVSKKDRKLMNDFLNGLD